MHTQSRQMQQSFLSLFVSFYRLFRAFLWVIALVFFYDCRMAPRLQLEKAAWRWVDTVKPEDITQEHIELAYRIAVPACKRGTCRYRTLTHGSYLWASIAAIAHCCLLGCESATYKRYDTKPISFNRGVARIFQRGGVTRWLAAWVHYATKNNSPCYF